MLNSYESLQQKSIDDDIKLKAAMDDAERDFKLAVENLKREEAKLTNDVRNDNARLSVVEANIEKAKEKKIAAEKLFEEKKKALMEHRSDFLKNRKGFLNNNLNIGTGTPKSGGSEGLMGSLAHQTRMSQDGSGALGELLAIYLIHLFMPLARIMVAHAEYARAQSEGLAFDPTNSKQILYKLTPDNKLDFTAPYADHEKASIPDHVIRRNQFIPKPSLTEALSYSWNSYNAEIWGGGHNNNSEQEDLDIQRLQLQQQQQNQMRNTLVRSK